MNWRRASIAMVEENLRDLEAGEADQCALFREWLRLSGKGVLPLAEEYAGKRLLSPIWRTILGRHRLKAARQSDMGWQLEDLGTGGDSRLPTDFWTAVNIDPSPRRPWPTGAADAPLLRYTKHSHYTCATQKAAFRALITMPAGQCLLVSMPTGSGKSLLFQAGVLFFRDTSNEEKPVAVVIVPTRALAEDHLKTLRAIEGLEKTCQLNGEMTGPERESVKEEMLAGNVPVVLASPEILLGWGRELLQRLATPSTERYQHEKGRLWALFIDEAHIIESWGRGFRPDFQRLPGIVSELRKPVANPDLRVILLSATLPASARDLLRQQYGKPGSKPLEIHASVPRTEFDLVGAGFSSREERREALREVIPILPRPAILYTTLVEDAVSYYKMLRDDFGYRRIALVTGEYEEPWPRKEIIQRWSSNRIDFVVATSAFGMGIDKSNVRAIVHACVPESPSRFYQEMGRGGRDGHQALELCLFYQKGSNSPRRERDDLDEARGLATHEFLTVDRAVERWRGLLADARQRGAIRLTSHGQEVRLRLDATPEDMDLQKTGRLNRGWNAVLLNLLQRQQALEVCGLDPEQALSEWTVLIKDSSLLGDGPNDALKLRTFLSAREEELEGQKAGVRRMRELLHGNVGDCVLLSLFREVEEEEVWGNCGRCAWCRQSNLPPDRRWRFGGTRQRWRDLPKVPDPEFSGRVILQPTDPYFNAGFESMIACLRHYAIQEHLVPERWTGRIASELRAQNERYGFLLTHKEFTEHAWLPIGWPLAVWLDPQESKSESFWVALESAIEEVQPSCVIVVGLPNLAPWSWRSVVYTEQGVCTS
jgi:ATP-dependent DNA helicase RecQ